MNYYNNNTKFLSLSAYGTIVSGVTAVDSLKKDEESGFPFVGNIFPAIRGIPVFLNRTIEVLVDEYYLTHRNLNLIYKYWIY